VIIAKNPGYVTTLECVTTNSEVIVTFSQFYLKLNNLFVRRYI